MKYIVNEEFKTDIGFYVDSKIVKTAILKTNRNLKKIPQLCFRSVDMKTISAIIGSYVCKELVLLTDGIHNPNTTKAPDIVSESNLTKGLEIKNTAGKVKNNSINNVGIPRIDNMSYLTWATHHAEVPELFGIVWDFIKTPKNQFNYPVVTGAFYSDNLKRKDWGKISKYDNNRTTNATSMKKSGKEKMEWVALLNNDQYIERYSKLLYLNV